MPLPIGPQPSKPAIMAVSSWIALAFLTLEIGLVVLITRHRPVPDLAERAPERSIAERETLCLWIYGAFMLLAGRWLGLHFFGEGIAMHLNGSLVGATRVQSPAEVYTWVAYNWIMLCPIPYVAFRVRLLNFQLNLKSILPSWNREIISHAACGKCMGPRLGFSCDLATCHGR